MTSANGFEYEQFVKTIQHRAEVSWDDAERAAAAVLTTLAERLSAGQARDLARQLPRDLGRWLASDENAEAFDAREFIRRVAEREEVSPSTAETHARAVFAALRRAVDDDEWEDLVAELSKDYGYLLAVDEPEEARPEPMPLEEFLERVADRAATDRDRALRATEAVLQTLAEKLAAGEVDDLAQQLPPPLAEVLEQAKTPKAERMRLEEFVRRVAEREGVPASDAREHAHAVFRTLREAVDRREWEDMTAELSVDYAPVLLGA